MPRPYDPANAAWPARNNAPREKHHVQIPDHPTGPDTGWRRRSIRLPGYDYSQPGAYFVTICTYGRSCLFGQVRDDVAVLSPAGQIALACWQEMPAHFPFLEPCPVVVMPNHVHGIIVIDAGPVGTTACPGSVGARHASPLRIHAAVSIVPTPPAPIRPRGAPRASLGAMVASYKSAVARRIHQDPLLRDTPVWQRGYYEHVVRDEEAWARICEYIETNPLSWDVDRENPDRPAAAVVRAQPT